MRSFTVKIGVTAQNLKTMAQNVANLVNQERAQYGLQPLIYDTVLASAATTRANEITEKFSHTRPNESSFTTVSPRARGENIAAGQATPASVMESWMKSQGHRENILRTTYSSIGVGVVLKGGRYYWTQLFGLQ